MDTKICCCCKQEKPLEDFHTYTSKTKKRFGEKIPKPKCKICENSRKRELWSKKEFTVEERQRAIERAKTWYENNKDRHTTTRRIRESKKEYKEKRKNYILKKKKVITKPKINIIKDENGNILEKQCSMCKVMKNLYEYNKGNALCNKKSWCRECQGAHKRAYGKRPEVRRMLREHNREYYKTIPAYKKTERYLKRKDYVKKWQEDNSERYRNIVKRKDLKRRKYIENAGVLEPESISILEHFNKECYGKSNFVCEYCKKEIIDCSYHLEHILPLSKNGHNGLNNIAIACENCNCRKLAKLLEDFSPDSIKYFDNRNHYFYNSGYGRYFK